MCIRLLGILRIFGLLQDGLVSFVEPLEQQTEIPGEFCLNEFYDPSEFYFLFDDHFSHYRILYVE